MLACTKSVLPIKLLRNNIRVRRLGPVIVGPVRVGARLGRVNLKLVVIKLGQVSVGPGLVNVKLSQVIVMVVSVRVGRVTVRLVTVSARTVRVGVIRLG